MIRFSLFGIPIQIQPWFWLSLAILGGATGADSPDGLLRICLFILAGFISILIHELGHALTARAFGSYSEITLEAFGGYATYQGARLSRPQSFAVTAAGPGVQIVLGLAFFALLKARPELSGHGYFFMSMVVWVSFAWAILNLLPVLPLDGGRMLETILGPSRIRVTLWVTIIVGTLAGIAVFYFTRSFLFPIFLGMFVWQASQALKETRWR